MRNILAALLMLIVTVTPAVADCGNIVMPPAQFLTPKVDAPIRWVPYWDVDPLCRALGVVVVFGHGRVEACNYRDDTGWHIVLPTGLDSETTTCLLVHERAHLPPNRWPADHPGGRFE